MLSHLLMEYVNFLLLLPVLFLLSKLFFAKKKNLPPSPPSIPIIGHLNLIKSPKPLFRVLANISDLYGPVVFLQLGLRPTLLVSSPSAAEECLTKNDIIFANRPKLHIGKYVGNNYSTLVWAPYGHNWRSLRKMTTLEIFSAQSQQLYTNVRVEEVRFMIKSLLPIEDIYADEYRVLELRPALSNMTLNIIMMMIAGKRYYGENANDLEKGKLFYDIMRDSLTDNGGSNPLDFMPFLKWFGYGGIEKQYLKIKSRRDSFVQDLIEEQRELKRSDRNDKEKKPNMIKMLLSLQEKEPLKYDDQMIRGILWVLLATGSDTSAAAMEFALSLLVNRPDALMTVQAEIDANVPQDRLLVEADMDNLPYFLSIITETLRMYPSGGGLLLPHESSEECIVQGYTIPRGTMLIINSWAIQNDPKIWDDPDEFRPERFKDLQGNRDGFKLIPFGAGRRGCPGEGVAMRVMGLALGSLLQCFEWKRIGEELVDMTEVDGMTLWKAQPLEVKCRPRPSMMRTISQNCY